MKLEQIASAIVPSGKHEGKRIRDLTRLELSGIYGAWNTIPVLKRKPFFKVLRAAVENFDALNTSARCTSVSPIPVAQRQIAAHEREESAENLLAWHLRNSSGFNLFTENGKWVVCADKITGWIVSAELIESLRRAKDQVLAQSPAPSRAIPTLVPKIPELVKRTDAQVDSAIASWRNSLDTPCAKITYIGASPRRDHTLPDSSEQDELLPWE